MLRERLDRQPYPDSVKLALARQLRREATPTERFAWSLLTKRRMLGLKLRRQHVVLGFIVDFYCPELRLVLELDGAQHAHAATIEYDAARTELLETRGYKVIRVRNEDLSREGLMRMLLPHSPSPDRERG